MTETDESIRPNFRQAGKQLHGKLVRGFIQDPINKTTSASIPYKFETILYKNNNPKGFGGSAQRVSRNEDLGPGPGSYDYDKNIGRSESASYSKKGYGNGFVSQSHRNIYKGYINSGPGPGSYDSVDKPFKVPHVTQEGKKSTSETTFKASQVERPGPGHYNPECSKLSNVFNSRVANSIFLSNTGRYNMATNANPPPGSYEIDRSLAEKKPFKHFLGSANFMLPAKKKINKEVEDKQVVDKLLGKGEEVAKEVPGPGYYFKMDKDDEIVLFNQKIQDKNSSNFVGGNVTRFGEVIQKKVKRLEYPGPGTYVQQLTAPQEKTLVSGAVFMSETARKPFNDNKTFVGPMKYNPELLPKKSYHLNINKQWV